MKIKIVIWSAIWLFVITSLWLSLKNNSHNDIDIVPPQKDEIKINVFIEHKNGIHAKIKEEK